jgi:hypothetical protein
MLFVFQVILRARHRVLLIPANVEFRHTPQSGMGVLSALLRVTELAEEHQLAAL